LFERVKRLLSAALGARPAPADHDEPPSEESESDRRIEAARQRLKETIPPRED
jgi:hypothetical protein